MKSKLVILMLLCISTQAQQIQWASKLIKYTSDLGGKEYGIKRILGKPDVFPQGGYSANAWTPKNALDGREVVVVGFEKPQTVKQVAVFENINAGCVVRIQVSADGEKFETVWSRRPDYKTPVYKRTLTSDRSFYFGRKRRKIEQVPDVNNPGIEYAILENAMPGITAVKVEFNFALLPGQKQIDAIGISDSEKPIEPQIHENPITATLTNAMPLILGSTENSIPFITPDGKKMYISRYEDGKEYIYSYTKVNGRWENESKENSLNTGDTYNYVEFASGSVLIKGGSAYSKGSGESGYELMETTGNGFISKGMIKIAAFANYDDYSDAAATADLNTLVLAIETDFTQGGTDLYFTKRKEDGTYAFLQNMGKVINSAAGESAPFLLSDTQTLFFASNGFSSYGSHDIYVSFRLDDTWKNWSEPINLGSKINSEAFECQPFYDEANEVLYFSVSSENKTEIKSIALPKSVLNQLRK